LEYWGKAISGKIRCSLFFHHSILPLFRRPVVPSFHYSSFLRPSFFLCDLGGFICSPLFISLVLSKITSPLPLGERVRVRGKNGILGSLSPPPFPSPLKGEGFPCPSVFSRAIFHNFFDIIIAPLFFSEATSFRPALYPQRMPGSGGRSPLRVLLF